MENHIEIYRSGDGQTQIDVTFEQDTVWLTNAQLVGLFDQSKTNISEYVECIFQAEELDERPTVRKSRTIQREGSRMVEKDRVQYNLDVIISVGYGVNSKRGTLFQLRRPNLAMTPWLKRI